MKKHICLTAVIVIASVLFFATRSSAQINSPNSSGNPVANPTVPENSNQSNLTKEQLEDQINNLQQQLNILNNQRASLTELLTNFNNKITTVTTQVQQLESQLDAINNASKTSSNSKDNSKNKVNPKQDNNVIGKAANSNSQPQLMEATKQMKETQMSFNLQYMQLQNMLQNLNQQFALISNIIKTKRDAARNALGSKK
jgi:chromosome segregation ATPase